MTAIFVSSASYSCNHIGEDQKEGHFFEHQSRVEKGRPLNKWSSVENVVDGEYDEQLSIIALNLSEIETMIKEWDEGGLK